MSIKPHTAAASNPLLLQLGKCSRCSASQPAVAQRGATSLQTFAWGSVCNDSYSELDLKIEESSTSVLASNGLYNNAHISLLSTVETAGNEWERRSTDNDFLYYYSDSAGAGVTVYAISEIEVKTSHPRWSGKTAPHALNLQIHHDSSPRGDNGQGFHSTRVSSIIGGVMLGV